MNYLLIFLIACLALYKDGLYELPENHFDRAIDWAALTRRLDCAADYDPTQAD